MTRETRGDSEGDAGSARQDGLLPLPSARRARPLLRPRRPPRRHLAHLEGLPERGCAEPGDRARAKAIARTLEGSPLVVGERSGTGPLEDGVIYSRFGVPILCRSTLLEFLEEGVPPFLFSAPGGLYVRLDAAALRRMREDRGLSLGALADIAGVSRRTIQMYLDGMAATLDVAMRLEDVLSESLALPVDPFAFVDDPAADKGPVPRLEGFERELFQRLQRLGYDVLPTARSPFDALSKRETTTFLTGVGGVGTALDRKVDVVANISRVVEKDSVMFVVRRARMSIRG